MQIERQNFTFLELRLAFALNCWAMRALAQGDLHLAARRQLLSLRLIRGVTCP